MSLEGTSRCDGEVCVKEHSSMGHCLYLSRVVGKVLTVVIFPSLRSGDLTIAVSQVEVVFPRKPFLFILFINFREREL